MKKLHLVTILLSFALLLGSIFFGALFLYASRDTVPSGVTINGVEIGNIERNEVTALVEAMIQSMEQDEVIVVIQQTEIDSTWKQLGVQYDASHFYDALAHLFHGNLWERSQARWHFPKAWELNITLDEKVLRKLFTPDWEQAHFGSPINAVRIVSAQDNISYLPSHSARRIDWSTFGAIVREQSLKRLQAPPTKKQKPPILEIPLYTLQPEVTIESLKQEGIRRKIAQFSTNLQGSGNGRRHNVDAAARTIHGMVLAPGDTFDYEQVIKAAEDKYGFQEAPVIYGGKLVPGVGGGICQVSSTLYNAVILAGLDIVERRNHTLPVSYVPKGLDATFARGYINFRFKNITDHHLLIQSEVKHDQLTVKLFGDMPEDITYDVESFTTKTLPAPNKYVANRTLSPGSQEIIIEGKAGYIVESYRIKKIAGKPVGKTKLSRDIYPPQPTVIAIHGDEDNSGQPSEDSSQRAGNHGSKDKDKSKANDAPKNAVPPAPGVEAPKIILEDGVGGPNF
ncbi:VanW family protein [Paenibacillus lentus]|uniref:VanW family protein n=1 Tax=Paenibacillus lentus TaxID=1338368 RepID=UPI003667666F